MAKIQRAILDGYTVENLFQRLSECPGFFWLDSSQVDPKNRYSFMGAYPAHTVSGKDSDSFPALVAAVLPCFSEYENQSTDLPLAGGAFGYFGYDCHPHTASKNLKSLGHLPGFYFGIYFAVVVVDHLSGQIWLTGLTPYFEKLSKIIFENPAFDFGIGDVQIEALGWEMDAETYQERVKIAQHHIHEGDVYQINLTNRFSSTFSGDLRALYLRFRQESPVGYGAYLSCGNTRILCGSPENFIRISGRHVSSRPIKGTLARHGDDADARQVLAASEKNRAELLMITDLIRHDLGQVCDYGSVTVPDLFLVETYRDLHHLVSTVTGLLRDDIDPVRALCSMLPGGSITGAPKRRAIQIIRDLETVPREIYTGAIGYFGFGAQKCSQFNIAIRSMYTVGDQLFYHAGCGIVADSIPESEWQELLVKSEGFFRSIQVRS